MAFDSDLLTVNLDVYPHHNVLDQAYGPANSPELDREIKESNGRVSDGASPARMALYRSAQQVPRYRFYGDPPLDETDEVVAKTCEWAFGLILGGFRLVWYFIIECNKI